MKDGQEQIELVGDHSSSEHDELISDEKEALAPTPNYLNAVVGGAGEVDPSNSKHALSEYTVDEAISWIGTGSFQMKLILITGILWSTDAMEMMIITVLQPVIIEIWDLNELQRGSIAFCVYGGMLCGTYTLGTLSDRFGRRVIIIVSIIGYSVASLLSAFSINYAMLLITRFIVGLFIGGGAVAFTLFAEFSPTAKRGRMLVLQQAFWCFGAIFASILGWLCMEYLNWRYFLMLSCIPLWTIALFSGWVPESPHYLMTVGRYEETTQTLARVAQTNNSFAPSGYLKTQIILNKKRGRIADVFEKEYRSTSILLYTMLGTSVFSYFGLSFIGERIFIDDPGDQYKENMISVLGEVPALLIGMIVMDRVGRKTTLKCCFLVYTTVCVLLCFADIRNVEFLGVLLVFSGRCAASLAFMTQFIYFSEFYPTAIRATAIGGASSLDEISKICADYLAQDISDITKAMMIFAAIGCISLTTSFLLPHETLGRQLNDDVDYGSKMELHTRGTMRVAIHKNK
eukprot:115410_1